MKESEVVDIYDHDLDEDSDDEEIEYNLFEVFYPIYHNQNAEDLKKGFVKLRSNKMVEVYDEWKQFKKWGYNIH